MLHRIPCAEIARFTELIRNERPLRFRSPKQDVPLEYVNKYTQATEQYAEVDVLPLFPGNSESDKEFHFRGADPSVLNSRFNVGIVGTVSPKADAFMLSTALAQVAAAHGALIVSGGAIGVDHAAHCGAIDLGKPTVAVVAHPVEDGVHPTFPERTNLNQMLVTTGGGFLSEYTDRVDEASRRARLLARDRLISALSDVLVVIECGNDSAAADSAKRAYIQNRAVVAIDWARVTNKHHEPDSTGASHLFDTIDAHRLPDGCVDNIESVAKQFRELLLQFESKNNRRQT